MEKRGLLIKLKEAGIHKKSRWWHSDEMRFGLWGQTRRRWGKRGVKIIQKIQIEYAWEYLVLAVDTVRAKLHWAWTTRMNQVQLIPVFEQWMPDAVVWDGASAHRGKAMGMVGFQRVQLPSYSPELNPPERVFEELRRQIEGKPYPSIAAKKYAIDQELRRLQANETRLKRLIGWEWLQEVYQQLPDCITDLD